MIVTISSIIGIPVLSLQTGKRLGTVGEPIIDPNELIIVAFYVNGPNLDQNPSVLHISDIREIGALGAIVDSSDNIMGLDGLVRLQQVIDYGFKLPGIKVIDDHKHKLGTVENYGINPNNAQIEQLYLRPTLTKQFLTATLTIHRNQIIEIDNKKIVVKSPDIKVVEKVQKTVSENAIPFENPFRAPQPETKLTE